ncbi:MAG: efflux RND transporter permease subunit, partial [Melioribacteraceae bacterium]
GIENMQSLGKITKDGKQYFIKANNSVTSIEKISNHTVKIFTNGKIIKLKDIGSVFDDFKETSNYYRINGKETISLVINREEGYNALDVAKKVYEKITELKSKLPADYIILKEIDKSESIREEIRELTKNAVYSFIIIVIVLLLIFRSIKISLIISVSIIFSLFFSFLLFFLFDIPLNIITISSFILGFGFMVDNSIVVVDFIEQHYSNDGIKRLSILLIRIFKPVFAATLTTVAVFIPLLFLTGELKLYFEQFALGIIFTLFASLVVSFTIIPMLFIKYHKKLNNSSAVKKITIWDKSYCLIERFIFHWKKMSLILLILIIGLPVWLIPTRLEESAFAPIYNSIFDTETYSEIKPYLDYALGGSLNLFFNHINRGEPWQFGEETYIYVRLELPNGNKIDRINKLTKDCEKEILRYKDNIKTLITNVYDEENANLRIDFNSKQGQTAFPYILKNYLTSYATRLGGLNVSVYGFGPGFSNAGSSFSNFSVISKGFNYLNTRKLAEDFKSRLIQNPRIDNVDIDKSEYFWDKDTYEIIAKVKRKELAGFNISPDEIINTIAKNTEGNLSWNTFRMDNDEVEYNIKFSNYKNIQLNEIENLFVVIKNSSLLKVKDVMDFEVKKVLSSINREDQQYIRHITFDYKGPFKYGDEFIKSVISKMNIKEGYSLAQREFSFRFGEEEEVEVWNILFYAVILIFMITASLFESLIKPILIITAIPFAIIGTFFLFYFTDLNLDRGAYAGILLLIGLAVNNSIILTDYISKNKNVLDFNEIIKLSSQRLRPIFTTTLTTIAALVPLLIGSEATFWQSLSYSVLGGLLLSSIVVVLFIPIFYYLVSRNKKTIKLYYSHN